MRFLSFFGLCLASLCFACSDDDAKPVKHSAESSAATSGTRSDAAPSQAEEPKAKQPLYVVSGYVFGDAETESTYIHVLKSLDPQELDNSKAREVPGRASIATQSGKVFVADGEAPIITRYALSEDGLSEETKVDFSDYGVSDIAIDDWTNIFISKDKAYLSNADTGNLIIWNPETMSITGEIDLATLRREGLDLDGSTPVLVGKYLLRVVFWKDWDAFESSEEQLLIVIDTDTDELVDMQSETRCPALSNRIDKDEQGNLYFSNWIYNVAETLLFDAPASCALRIKAGERKFDADWKLDFKSLTEGREAAGFSYFKKDVGFLSVFHDEQAEIADDTSPDELSSSANWRIWRVDVKGNKAEPVAGLDYLTGAYSMLEAGGETLLMLPTAEYDKTLVYAVSDSGVEERFSVQGFSYQVLEVR